jgi:DNA topoisomerase-1
MSAAQSLYENGLCTYIRTDSIRIGDETINGARDYLTQNNHKVPKKPNSYKNQEATQDAHEAIYPTDLTLLPSAGGYTFNNQDEKDVYEMIWKYFLASQMTPAIYDTLKITAHIQGDKNIEIKASGKALKDPGFLSMLGITDDSSIDIPLLSVGDILTHFGKAPVKMEKKSTQPPPRYSEDKLIKELENRKIGRPATFADLLSKVATRHYVEKRGNVYHATDLGKKITNELCQFFTFMDINYTAQMEAQLDEIESGKLDHIQMLKQFYPNFKSELDQAYIQNGGSLCQKCGFPMLTRTNKTTQEKFLGCSQNGCYSTQSLKAKVA